MTNQIQATAYKNGLLNIKDGRGVTQTYYITSGGYTWRDYDGQIGVTKTPGSWSDFWVRIQESYKEVNNV